MVSGFDAVTRCEGRSFYSMRNFCVDMRGVHLPVFSRVPVQPKGVIDEEEVRGINRLYLGNHLLNRPDSILLPQCLADATEFAIVRTPAGCLDADRDRSMTLILDTG